MGVPKIITKRLTLREIQNKDIFAHTELFSDSETMQLFGAPVITDDSRLKNIIETRKTDFVKGYSFFWCVTLRDEKEFIGFIRLMSYNSYYFDSSYCSMGDHKNDPRFLHYIDKNGWEVDYALLRKYRMTGIMSECMEAVLEYCRLSNMLPLYAKVSNVNNIATVRLLKKFEFKELLPQVNDKGQSGMIYKYDI